MSRLRIGGAWKFVPVLIATLLIIAACGGDDPTPTVRPTSRPTATTLPTPTATPDPGLPTRTEGRRGGVLQLRSPFNINTWDSYDVRAGGEWPWIAPMLSNLITPDPYNETVIVGELAESWTVSRDGTVITFKLRDAQWHDGVPVTAADIVYNLNRAVSPAPEAAPLSAMRGYVVGIVDVQAVDDLTVRITLDEPSASIFDRLGVRQFAMYPAHLPFPESFDEWKANPIGTGPFRFSSYKSDESLEFVRNDNYFFPGLPYLDGVSYSIINYGNEEFAAAAFRTGQFMAVVWDATTIQPIRDTLVAEQGFVLHTATAGRSDLHLNNRPPWDDQRVRQAISIGLNRQLIVDVWLEGEGNTLASPVIPPSLGGRFGLSAAEMEQRPGFPTATSADLERAKALLAEAGVDPSTVTIKYQGQQAFARAGAPQAIAAALSELGFKVDINIPDRTALSQALRAGDFDMHHLVRSLNHDGPLDNGGMESLLTGNSDNSGKWEVPEFDVLAAEQDRTLDPGRRAGIIDEMQKMYLDHASSIPILYRDYVTGWQSYVKNYPLFRFTFSPFYRWEQVWLDQ